VSDASSPDARIADRYGRRSTASRLFPLLAVAIIVAVVAWAIWLVWLKSTPVVSSTLATWDVIDDHTAAARLRVTMDDDAKDVSCLVRAYAEDHTTVGELTFVPRPGNNDVTIRTERMATAVESVGCTAAGQNDAR
jgi:hypothetical protein